MPAETNTLAAPGGAKPSPDEPEPNRAIQDSAMTPTPRSSRETGSLPPGRTRGHAPGLDPGGPRPTTAPLRPSGGREPAPDAIRGRGPVATAAGRACPGPDPGVRWELWTHEIPPREIAFLDPGVADLTTLLGHLRPAVEAILLDPARPAAHQIAAALAEERDLAAIHIIAHGAPGRVNFTAGDWSAATLEEETEDLATIGQALGAGRNVNLWSCRTAAGPAGAAFIAGLARASGADLAAATGLVGATALGGGWELTTTTQPPLTAAGMTGYDRQRPSLGVRQ